MTRRSLILLGSLPLLTNAAFAADLPSRPAPPVYAPPPIIGNPWTGFYLGANAGAAFGGSNSASTVGIPIFNAGAAGAGNLEIANDAASTNTLGASSRPSAIVGGQIGYNYQFATSYVAGIELDASALPGSGRSSFINLAVPVPGFPNTVLSTTSVSTRKDYIGTVRARIGYTFTPALLVYATGGFAYGGISSNTSTVDGVNPPAGIPTFVANGSKSSTLPGYTVGGGLEYLFTPHLSIKAEFLYYDIGSVKYSGGTLVANGLVAAPFTIDSVQTRVRYNGEIARVGLNYHFYTDPAPVVARY